MPTKKRGRYNERHNGDVKPRRKLKNLHSPRFRCRFFFLVIITMIRRIWIDPALVLSTMDSKEALDALALCCMVKLTFVDSLVKDASVRRMMKIFHISYGRCVKAVEEGIKRGLFARDGGGLRASKVKTVKEHCVHLDIPVSGNKGECPIGIAKMCDQLRGAVLYNHIAKQNNLRDTIRLACDPERGELKAMRRARTRLRKKGVCVDNRSASEVVRLSYAKAASILNVSKTKAKTLIKSMRDKGLIRRVLQYEETGLHLDEFTKELQEGHSKYGGRGFMVLCGGMVCLQLANAYLLCVDSLVKFIY